MIGENFMWVWSVLNTIWWIDDAHIMSQPNSMKRSTRDKQPTISNLTSILLKMVWLWQTNPMDHFGSVRFVLHSPISNPNPIESWNWNLKKKNSFSITPLTVRSLWTRVNFTKDREVLSRNLAIRHNNLKFRILIHA